MCREPQAATEKPAFRKSLRNAAINYRNGWFFVTSQVAPDTSTLRRKNYRTRKIIPKGNIHLV